MGVHVIGAITYAYSYIRIYTAIYAYIVEKYAYIVRIYMYAYVVFTYAYIGKIYAYLYALIIC